MAKVKQYRWVCPECGSAKHAPQAPRRKDVRRYCLPCSEATGVLVERTCPVLDAKRERKKAAERARAARRAERNKARRARERAEAEEAEKREKEARAAWKAKKQEREADEARRQEEIDALDPDVDPFDDPLVVDLRSQLMAWAKGTKWTIGRYRGAVVVHGRTSIPVWTKLEHRIVFDEALHKHRAEEHGVRVTSYPPVLIHMTPTAFCDWAVAVLEELNGKSPP